MSKVGFPDSVIDYYYGSMMSFCLLRGRNVLSTQKSQGELTSSLIDLQRAESEIMIRVIMNVGGLRILRSTIGGIRSDTK